MTAVRTRTDSLLLRKALRARPRCGAFNELGAHPRYNLFRCFTVLGGYHSRQYETAGTDLRMIHEKLFCIYEDGLPHQCAVASARTRGHSE